MTEGDGRCGKKRKKKEEGRRQTLGPEVHADKEDEASDVVDGADAARVLLGVPAEEVLGEEAVADAGEEAGDLLEGDIAKLLASGGERTGLKLSQLDLAVEVGVDGCVSGGSNGSGGRVGLVKLHLISLDGLVSSHCFLLLLLASCCSVACVFVVCEKKKKKRNFFRTTRRSTRRNNRKKTDTKTKTEDRRRRRRRRRREG